MRARGRFEAMWIAGLLAAALLACVFPRAAVADEVNVQYHGSGWLQFGRIESSSDTVTNGPEYNFNKNWIQNTGGQITAVAKIDKNWEGGLGLGAIQVSNSRGSLSTAHTWTTSWNPFVTEARVTYSKAMGEGKKLQLTLGSFPYDYNPDIRNFGLYLTRGQVYPGTLFSGFETKHILPIASQVGTLARLQLGNFQNDILINSETETKPYFDFSVADIASYQIAPWLQVGAGVNFYRLIKQRSKVTSPGTDCEKAWTETNMDFKNSNQGVSSSMTEKCFILDTVSAPILSLDTSIVDPSVDSAAMVLRITPTYDAANMVIDTITGSMAGTKAMVRFRFDPKPLFFSGGAGRLGKQDLVLYGEAAVLGFKNYPKYYDDIQQRMPMMIGFNLPAFGLLDRFALEVEYYGSQNYPDYYKAEINASSIPRNITTIGVDSSHAITYNGHTFNKLEVTSKVPNTRNDWKWSLYASRVLMAHLKIAAQVADDHLVLPPPSSAPDPSWTEVLTTPKDWYWMMKLAYFF